MFFGCSVCTEVLTSDCEITSTYCGHVFHTNCIMKWIGREQNCPQCRTGCTDKRVHRIYLSESPKVSLIPDLLQMAAKNGHLPVYELALRTIKILYPNLQLSSTRIEKGN